MASTGLGNWSYNELTRTGRTLPTVHPCLLEPALFEVRQSPVAGRGLFATKKIAADTLLMEAPVLVVPGAQRDALRETLVDDYVYEWDDDGAAGLVLGVSSMCNHSNDPNAYLWLVPDTESAELWTIKPIRKNEEITVSYRAEGGGELWFDIVDG